MKYTVLTASVVVCCCLLVMITYVTAKQLVTVSGLLEIGVMDNDGVIREYALLTDYQDYYIEPDNDTQELEEYIGNYITVFGTVRYRENGRRNLNVSSFQLSVE